MPLLDPTFVSTNAPSANVAASATHAGVTGKVHVCQTIHTTFNATSTAPAAAQVALVLRDGASGTGTVLWSSQMSLPAVAGQSSPPVEVSGLAITGTAGNSMTLEFVGAGGANTALTVAFTGFLC